MRYLLIPFGVAQLALGGFWLVMSYRCRSRGDVWLGVAHAAALIVVGLLALGAALAQSNMLMGLAGFVLLGDVVARSVLARRRSGAGGSLG